MADLGNLAWKGPLVADLGSLAQERPLVANEAGKKVAKSPGLSLFRREESVDGNSNESYALSSYRSRVTSLIEPQFAFQFTH